MDKNILKKQMDGWMDRKKHMNKLMDRIIY